MIYIETLIVNLFAGPGCGKSTLASYVFSKLKMSGINAELITEFAKDLVWENREQTFNDELYVFAKQHHKIFRVNGKVEVIITDSPLLLKLYYMSKDLDFSDLVYKVHSQYINLNFVLNRVKKYNPVGRNQTEEEARQSDLVIKDLLDKYNISYRLATGDEQGANFIYETVMNTLHTSYLFKNHVSYIDVKGGE